MAESSWVRSVYLYAMCAISLALALLGVGSAVVGLVHTISPDLGHRDTLDRVGIGLTNIAEDVIGVIDEGQRESIEDFCADVTEGDDEFDECVEGELAFGGSAPLGIPGVNDGIGEVRSEFESQIRNSSIDRMIRGAVLIMAGLVLWRIHASRTEVFANGLLPARKTPSPAAPNEITLQPLPVSPPTEPLPIQPSAPPPPPSPPSA